MCVIENGEVLFNQAYGVTDAKSTRRWEKNSPVQIASMTKSITSTLVAVLVGEGKLTFDDPISKYIPEYGRLKMRKSGPEVRSPTIAECLSHTWASPVVLWGVSPPVLRSEPVTRPVSPQLWPSKSWRPSLAPSTSTHSGALQPCC